MTPGRGRRRALGGHPGVREAGWYLDEGLVTGEADDPGVREA